MDIYSNHEGEIVFKGAPPLQPLDKRSLWQGMTGSGRICKSTRGMEMWSILLSVTALLISGYVLWATHLKSFQVEVEVGSPMLALVEHKKESGLYALGMVLPIDLVNTGARGGTVKDMLIKLDTENADYPFWFMHPYFFADEYSAKALEGKNREVFHPMYVRGKESIFRNIIFTPIVDRNPQPPTFPLSKAELPAGKYTMTLFLLDSSSSDFRKVRQLSFRLSEERVALISNTPYIPRLLEVMEARDRFFKSTVKITK